MKPYSQTSKLVLLANILVLSACAFGPAEKPLPDSMTSPGKLLNTGIHYYNNNNYPKAIDNFEKALLQYRSIDNQTGIANSCMNLAKTFMDVNNNQLAASYLSKANIIITQASLLELKDHLQLLTSTLAINNGLYDQATQELSSVLISKNTNIRLAALKNRSKIAFIQNHGDKQQWLQQYKNLQQANPANTSSHHARILRFESELADDVTKKAALLKQALSISQNSASRTAIAATLTQWAQISIDTEEFDDAEDKALRALFIRHQLGDVKNSLAILNKLQNIYAATDENKYRQTKKWVARLSNNELSNWEQLFSDFENYPRMR